MAWTKESVIKYLTQNYEIDKCIERGRMKLRIHNVGVIFLFEEETDTGFMLIGSAISMLLLGGIIGGLAEMVKAACIHNWEFDQKMRQIELEKIADEEVEPFADFQEE